MVFVLSTGGGLPFFFCMQVGNANFTFPLHPPDFSLLPKLCYTFTSCIGAVTAVFLLCNSHITEGSGRLAAKRCPITHLELAVMAGASFEQKAITKSLFSGNIISTLLNMTATIWQEITISVIIADA